MLNVGGGASRGNTASTTALLQWAYREGMAGGLENYDWRKHDLSTISQQQIDRIEKVIAEFLLTKTKRELYEGALKYSIMVGPLNNVQEVLEDPQLAAREYFVNVEHNHLADSIAYPGSPVRLGHMTWRTRRRAPLIGEHNRDIYENELRLTASQLVALKAAGVI